MKRVVEWNDTNDMKEINNNRVFLCMGEKALKLVKTGKS